MTAHPTATIEKMMTLSAAEFAKSMAAFVGPHVVIANASASVAITESGGSATIAYHPLPPRRVGGGLLELPQAKVTITLTDVPPAEAEAFLRRFDIAFQRGGG